MSELKKTGFSGANYTVTLGYQRDMIAFFDLVQQYAVNDKYDDWSIITNRLYRHYIAREDWDRSIELMEEIHSSFAKVESVSINWDALVGVDTRLDISGDNLAIIFDRFFERFPDIVEGSRLADAGDYYCPITTVLSDRGVSQYFDQKTLEEFDALTGTPLWLRDDLGELKEKVYPMHYTVTSSGENGENG